MRPPVHIVRQLFVWSLFSTALIPSALVAQTLTPALPSDHIVIHPLRKAQDSLYTLPHTYVAIGTDTLILDSTIVLQRDKDYLLFSRRGTLRFTDAFWQRMNQKHIPEVTIRCRYVPYTFRASYERHTITFVKDSTDTLRVARPGSAFNIEDIFGENLQKSGSIFRGFTVGTNRDLSLSSGLRMQLSGKLAQDVEISAALTDENTPIQPEGTTQTLQEFDKVYVDIRGRDLGATLGDFELNLKGTEFAQLSRKLQGAKGDAVYRLGFADGDALAAAAITRGKFNSMQFNGIEGVQGPYILSGKNGEQSIIVVAGTERVYINGEEMVRGETNDYTIDYSIGEITFSPRRLVTAESRITVDFEYSDRQFSRSLLAAQTHTSLLSSHLKVGFTFLREADDPNNPIDLVLSDSVRQVIGNAGADSRRAVMSGVTAADSGGLYMRVDTLLSNGTAVTFYRYAPGNPAARYQVVFSQVGSGAGDYIRQQLGVFQWQGPGGGDYLAIRFLPLPQSQQMMDVAVEANPSEDLFVTGEFAGTSMDPNRLSYQNVTVQGHGINGGVEWKPSDLRIGSLKLGRMDLSVHERYTSNNFNALDRTTDIEYTRKWGIDSLTQTSEEIQEASLKYSPDSALTLEGGYGRNSRGASFRSVRDEGQLTLRAPGIPHLDYSIESIRSGDNGTEQYSSWLRQKGRAEQTFGILTPSVTYEGERRTFRGALDQVLDGSFAFDNIGAGIVAAGMGPLSLSAAMGWRSDALALAGTLLPESKSVTQTYGARLAEWNNLSSQVDVTLRKKSYTPAFINQGNPDVRSVLVRDQTRYSPLNRGVETDLLYEVSTERTARLERVFAKVTVGSGNYKYLGDLNGNGVADESEFVPARFDGDYVAVTVPSSDLVPVIDLKTGWRTKITPSRWLENPTGFGRILAALSSETYVRVDEKSTEHDLKQIYLLHFSKFLRDSTTMTGSRLITQDLNVLDGNPLFSSRVRFTDRKSLNNLSGGIEKGYARERSLRLRWQLIPEVSNQIDLVNQTDRLTSNEISSRTHDISSNDVTLDFAYRPEQDLEIGFKVEVSQATDDLPAIPVEANLNAQSLRTVYAFRGAGQLRVEFGREEMLLRQTPEIFPYDLTGGRVAGITWLWRLAFDYRVTQFLQATLNYDGRIEGGGFPIHTARGEVKAFF